MKFKTVDGRVVSVDLRRKNTCRDISQRSKGQEHLSVCIARIYQFVPVFEEFIIPGEQGLSLDFFIPQKKIAFEFNGQQHYEYNKFFHNSKIDFLNQQKRDNRKREWCRVNNVTLVEVVDQKISLESLGEMIEKAIRKQSNY